jgi:hypothetical protein
LINQIKDAKMHTSYQEGLSTDSCAHAAEATFHQSGARFRIRLLYKSHVCIAQSNQRQAESFYACLFCVQSGSTVREGDATVFTSSDDLLLHLARHPQPLPVVPGVTVLYDNDNHSNSSNNNNDNLPNPDPRANNDFDLHLPNPPLPIAPPDLLPKTAVATATREHRQRYGAKTLPRPDRYGGAPGGRARRGRHLPREVGRQVVPRLARRAGRRLPGPVRRGRAAAPGRDPDGEQLERDERHGAVEVASCC